MKDEYMSVEHLFMGLLEKPTRAMKELWDSYAHYPQRLPAGSAKRAGQQPRYRRDPGGHL